MNPLGPAFRAETQTDPTVPPLAEALEEATAVAWRPANRDVLRRVKLAKMPAPTGFSRFAASQSVAGLAHDPIGDVGERDQPRVGDRACEESSGTAGRFVEAWCS